MRGGRLRLCVTHVCSMTDITIQEFKHSLTHGKTAKLMQLGLWLRLECSLDSLSIDSAHVIYVAEGHNVGAERQSSVMTLRKPIVTWII